MHDGMTPTEIRAQLDAIDRWYLRNRAAVDKWLRANPLPHEMNAVCYAFMEMPNPETWFGRFLLWLGL
jgi:hypothetical protein